MYILKMDKNGNPNTPIYYAYINYDTLKRIVAYCR